VGNKLPYYEWGIVAGGSTKNLSLPTTGSDTYCGSANYYYINSAAKVSGPNSAKVAMTVNWQTKKLMTLSIARFGQTLANAYYAIASPAGATRAFMATYGNFPSLNGPGAEAAMHFYGHGRSSSRARFRALMKSDQSRVTCMRT
jgi:hypothetical protein